MNEVEYEQADGVGIIRINRADQRNSINRAVAEGIAAALDLLEASQQSKAMHWPEVLRSRWHAIL